MPRVKVVFTEEWKRNISKGKMGSIVSEETKKAISKTLTGKPKTEEHRRNISRGMKKVYIDPKDHPNFKDGRTLRKYYCVDCGKEISYNRKRCPSCANKALWRDDEYRGKVLKAMGKTKYKEASSKKFKKLWKEGKMDGVYKSPTKPEKRMMGVLEELGVDYIFQFRPKDYSMTYDFYVPNKKLLIEFDGVYWHSLEKVKIRDKEKTQYAKSNNYNLLRFSESNLDTFKETILSLMVA